MSQGTMTDASFAIGGPIEQNRKKKEKAEVNDKIIAGELVCFPQCLTHAISPKFVPH